MAAAPTLADVLGGALRRAAGQDPRRRRGAYQGDLRGAGRIARRHTRHPRAVGRVHRGCEVLDEGLQ